MELNIYLEATKGLLPLRGINDDRVSKSDGMRGKFITTFRGSQPEILKADSLHIGTSHISINKNRCNGAAVIRDNKKPKSSRMVYRYDSSLSRNTCSLADGVRLPVREIFLALLEVDFLPFWRT